MTLYVFLGVALLECVPSDPGAPAYRMLLARLVNAGFGVTALGKLFNHDGRTLRKWADALACGDGDKLAAALAGRGASAKVTGALQRFVKMQYRALRGRHRDYRRRIMAQTAEVFGESISRETARRLFREADREGAVAASAWTVRSPSADPGESAAEG
nr:hypothetical protein [bacterium]